MLTQSIRGIAWHYKIAKEETASIKEISFTIEMEKPLIRIKGDLPLETSLNIKGLSIFQKRSQTNRNSHQRCSIKIGILKNFVKFTLKHLCQSFFFNKVKTLVQVFSSGFCKIFKNNFIIEHLRTTVSELIST